MSSFGSSAINKSGKKPVPRAARRRAGAGIETQTQSQPATPALSAISVASSEDPPPAPLPSHTLEDGHQQLADESLITHAANETSQSARDATEVRLQHRSEELVRQRERDGLGDGERLSDAATPSSGGELKRDLRSSLGEEHPSHATAVVGALGDRRVEMRRQSADEPATAPDTAQLEQPHIQQRLIDATNRVSRNGTSVEPIFRGARAASANTAFSTSSDAGSVQEALDASATTTSTAMSGVTTNKRKRAAGIKDFPYKRPKHLQTSGEITLESLEAEVQPSIEGPVEEAPPTKKPRKVRKDKGVPRKKLLDQSQAGARDSGDVTPAIAPTSTRELRKRPTATPQVAPESLTNELSGDEGAQEGEIQRRKRKKRKSTPDGNEDIQIDPTEVQMADMLVDKRTGKVSTLEKRMREIDWTEVYRKRKAARMPPEEGEGTQAPDGSREDDEEGDQAIADSSQEDNGEAAAASAPARQRTRMLNGVITVVDEALHVDRHAEGDAEIETLEVVEHEDLTERITSNSWIDTNRRDPVERKYGRRKADPWNLRDTDKFYEALRMFGTDFFVIAKMFKGKTRRQVKMKFVREEHDDPDRVKRALHGERKLLDIEAFKAVTGITHFKSPEEILTGLEEDRREREEQIVRAREEYDEEERQKKFLEASGGGAGADNVESAKENEAPGAKGKKKAKVKSKKSKGPVASADQAAEVVETIEE